MGARDAWAGLSMEDRMALPQRTVTMECEIYGMPVARVEFFEQAMPGPSGYFSREAQAMFINTHPSVDMDDFAMMLDTVVHFLWSSDMTGFTFVGDEEEEKPVTESQSFVELIYETADGWMAVSAHTDVTWKGLATAAGKPEWLDDPRFATVEARDLNKPARLELTQSVLITDTTANWMERLTAHDVPCAPVLTRAQVWQHPQVQANGAVIESDHAQAGRIRQARHPARFSATPVAAPAPAPALGADTVAVLSATGLSPEEIAQLTETQTKAAE